MDVTETRHGRTVLLEAHGRLDSNTAKAFEEKVLGSIEAEKPSMVIDLSGLDYVSSAGLRVLLMAAKRIKTAHGALALSGLKPHVQEVFDVSGFSSIFTIRPDRDAALAAAAA
jgi:anti-anti-sigma factor